jgi:hypothetical protein
MHEATNLLATGEKKNSSLPNNSKTCARNSNECQVKNKVSQQ